MEVLQSVRPQHFLPVHGEYAFLTEHALLARERAGVNFVDVSISFGTATCAVCEIWDSKRPVCGQNNPVCKQTVMLLSLLSCALYSVHSAC